MKYLFVGGPGHGQMLELDLKALGREAYWAEDNPDDKPKPDGVHGVVHTAPPKKISTYYPRKLVTRRQQQDESDWRTNIFIKRPPRLIPTTVFVHASVLPDDVMRETLDAVLESGLLK
jgi:hypothetical protein